jgi:hypothetical protein
VLSPKPIKDAVIAEEGDTIMSATHTNDTAVVSPKPSGEASETTSFDNSISSLRELMLTEPETAKPTATKTAAEEPTKGEASMVSLDVASLGDTSMDSVASFDILDPVEEPKTEKKKKRIKRTTSGDKKSLSGSKSGERKKKSTSKAAPTEESPVNPPKPLMNLRGILAKREKKPEPLPVHVVDFYGSMSAIPFLKPQTSKKKKKVTKKTGDEESGNAKKTVSDEKKTKKQPTEISMNAEYDDEQLKMWKSMTAFDNSDVYSEDLRPKDELPLEPGVRAKKKHTPSKGNAVRAHNRHDEWLNPNLKAQEKKSYFEKPGSAKPVKKDPAV